jgi:hypothetical protein
MMKPSSRMRSIFKSIPAFAVAVVISSCAQTEARTPAKAAPVGSRFDSVGRVTMHQGEPCAPQVMFTLTAQFKKPVALAAPFRESRALTEAVRAGRRVHVTGVWRHGRKKDCGYVEVTQVTRL